MQQDPKVERKDHRQAAAALPPTLTRALNEKQVFTPSGERTELHSNVTEDECLLLYNAVREIRPEVGLEVGFAQGISTLAILKGMEDNGIGHHHVIDPYQRNFGNCGLAMVKQAGLAHRLSFYEKFAEEVIPSLPRIQFAFIDSSHLFDLTLSEFVLADKRLDIGGVIGFHDTWLESQKAFIRFVLNNRSYEVYQAVAQSSPGDTRISAKARIKARIGKIVGRLPKSNRLFSSELLKPWATFRFQNLVLLCKTSEDSRHWTHHSGF